jgi:multicomponent Na+:H+ antiporter subunit C
MILTAIVITMGIAAFVLALTYRSYRLSRDEVLENDVEDTRVSRRSVFALDEDRPEHLPSKDTDAPDELDALPGHEGSR